MTAQSAIPLKWYVPFAQSDSARVEVPVTSSDPTRASQTLGFPPLTMQPPAVGGVPPQGEDFNGAMNQVARIAWWVLNGGGWPYDATFATNANIGGYPNGAVLQSADFLGQWISTTDNNQNNPDTVGTGWVPGFQYGSTALTGQTGGTTTLTPLQAAKRSISVAGTLTSALTLVLPAWVKDWSITNNTTGAFTVTAKTAAGSGVTIPQNGSPTPVAGDGTNITQNAQNIAVGTTSTHAAQVSQTLGRLLNVQVFTANGTYTPTSGTSKIIVEATGGGGSGGGANTSASIGGGGSGGAFARVLISGANMPASASVTIGAGAAGNSAAGGSSGGSTSFGAFVTVGGGNGGSFNSGSVFPIFTPPAVAPTGITVANATTLDAGYGGTGGWGIVASSGGTAESGAGGASGKGVGGAPCVGTGNAGVAARANSGAGGSGACNNASGGSNFAGGAGGSGLVVVYEYA